jgi:hypothetical protein
MILQTCKGFVEIWINTSENINKLELAEGIKA